MFASTDALQFDSLILFAARNEAIAPELLEILRLDTRQCTPDDAVRHFSAFAMAAEKGSPFAMCICSRFSRSGWGRPKSPKDALYWAQKAAAAGYAPGSYQVGECYLESHGEPANLELARLNLERASDDGFGFASYRLAVLLHEGKFGSENRKQALSRAVLAFEMGESIAAFEIAGWHERGEIVPRDESDAVVWYERAASMGNMFANLRLSVAYSIGELGLPRDPIAAEKYARIGEAQTPL
jgi:hypothetical protein